MKSKSSAKERTTMRVRQCLPLLSTTWSFMLLLLVFAVGCKKVIEEEGRIGICPVVISTTPANAAITVSLNASLVATFNEVMDGASLTKSTFSLYKGTTKIDGSVSTSGSTATFTPASILEANTIYTATITTGARDLQGNALEADYVWSFTTGSIADAIAPTVNATDPLRDAIGVALNKKVTATFSEEMNPLSVNGTTFVLKQGTTIVQGTVSYSNGTAVFSPLANLAANTLYTATVTTGVRDVAGNTMAVDYTWSFTTGSTTDVTLPVITSTDPANGATGVIRNKKVSAVFSKAMNPSTINAITFVVKQGATTIAGAVSYAGMSATFSPFADFASNTTYTATITTGAKDLAGNAMAANYVWSFTTGLAIAPPPLGSAAMFGVFGGSAGITNQGLNTVINGSIGTTGVSTLITGFHDGTSNDIYTETTSNVGLVTGRIYTAPPLPGTATSFAIAQQGLLDATIAYNSISPASKPGGTDPGAGELGGLTLAPGIYKSASGTFKITNGNLTLDAMGDPNAVWIFQTAAGLTVGIAGPTGARSIIMKNQAQPKNVFWYVGSAATINGAGGGTMVGNIIASAGVTFSTAGNAVQTVLNGRAISLNASVTVVNTTINVPN